jgi:hypothetical protein
LDQAIGKRALAMIDVRNDRKISDVVHCLAELLQGRFEATFERDAASMKTRGGVGFGEGLAARENIKKRHVESMTRLPTKRLATACWDFIVVKTGRLQTAPVLDFLSLQDANSENYQQVIHKCLWMSWG